MTNKNLNASAISNLEKNVKHDISIDELFDTIHQGTATNALTKIRNTKTNTQVDNITGIAKVRKGEFTLSINNFNSLPGFKTSTHQLLDALTVVLTTGNQDEYRVNLPLKDYMAWRGLKDKKEARKQVKEDLEVLFNSAIRFKGKRNKDDEEKYLDMHIIATKGEIEHGIIYTTFNPDFYNLLKSYPIMAYPKELWKLNNKTNSNSFYFGRKISEHRNMNFDKSNRDLISVRALLEATPNIPTYEEVANSNRHFTDRIITPFERDMDALSNIIQWEYCHSNNAPLSDAELEHMDYDTFINLLVHITWLTYPNETKRIETKKKRKTKKTTKAK